MKVYHGSISVVKEPQLLETQRFLDFGKAFYTTTNQLQAEKWAQIKQKRSGSNTVVAYVNVYSFDEALLDKKIVESKIFDVANEEWLDFIMINRNGTEKHNYDIVKGAVANDTLYQTLTLFESGILTKQETIIRLKVHKLFDQIAFCSNKAIQLLDFHSYYTIKYKSV